ncbi:SDR family NAD(P)-dependent oxidoreductase [Streptacidiphilus anmyonensis]|uniref:SDR family NAD(P)-dependent oxidoreductase n=1 Tax=Streptacidiphilus anmyonensis TaxID=405782 RepID=UPI001F46FE88|nr:SDR family NAD(P)-dependent oxidoreductase [Streptacidiphilus anmyonensis]
MSTPGGASARGPADTPHSASGAGRPRRVLLIGGTSEIGLATLRALRLDPADEAILAGRDARRLADAGVGLPCRVTTAPFDALDPVAPETLAARVLADGPLDLAVSAAGVLIPQDVLDADPRQAGELVQTDFTAHVTVLLALAAGMREQRHGTLVVLSSIAAVRPRRANLVYGAAKAGLDAFARGLADRLHGTGVSVVLVRPGFVTGRMTHGMRPAPMSSTPQQVAAAVAAALDRGPGSRTVWVPRGLVVLAAAMRLLPRPLWRRLPR